MTALDHRAVRAVVFAGLLGCAAPALAQPRAPEAAPGDVSQEQALALAARLQALEQRNGELRGEMAELRARVASRSRAIREKAADRPRISLAGARPELSTADGASSFAWRALVQVDGARYGVDPLRPDNELGSGTIIRRARLGFEATAFGDWNFALGVGLGGDSTALNQAYVEYVGLRPFGPDAEVRLRIGAWSSPAGLEDSTNNAEGVLLERAAVIDLVRGFAAGDGHTGAGAFASGRRWYGSAVWVGKVVGEPAAPEFDHQSAFVLRAAFNPLHGRNHDAHLGGSVQGVLSPADIAAGPREVQTVRLRERLESRVTNVRLVDTGEIRADGLVAYGLEAGASYKNFYVSGEWFRIDVDRTMAGAAASPFDPSFSGWYLQGAWTLTGERHVWSARNGGFRGVRPDGGWGAWELAARYSVLDLNDHAGSPGAPAPAGGIRGGEQKIATVGLNWYPNSVLRLLLNYQQAKVERLTAAGADMGEQVNVVSLRSQFGF